MKEKRLDVTKFNPKWVQAAENLAENSFTMGTIELRDLILRGFELAYDEGRKGLDK